MSTIAIVMMIVALVAVWGGLALALLNLKRHPEEEDDAAVVAAGSGPSSGSSADNPGGGSPAAGGQGRHRSDS